MLRFARMLIALLLAALALGACAPISATPALPAADADPLPSWNPGPTKDAILAFVADTTDGASAGYVAPADRIAVFDNDGTLWSEQPVLPQAAFAASRIVQMAPDHPEWWTTEPYQAVLEQGIAGLADQDAAQIEQILFTTHAGMTEEEFEATAQDFLATALHPRFGRPYTATVYQPMLELLALLQANDFQTFIVSGGGVEFVRVFSEAVYGIPRQNVIGSSLQYQFEVRPESSALVRLPQMDSFDDKEMKPANIQLHIGRRPILAAGNSDGDLAMFQYTAGRPPGETGAQLPYLNLLVVHDDADREYEHLANTDAVMAAAAQSPWLFVSMRRDFKTVFPPAAAPAAPPATGWQVETLLAGPGELDRLYALLKDSPGPLWAVPAAGVRLLVSDDFGETWLPFPGGLPVPAACMVNVNPDHTSPGALYASTCQGLYAWDSEQRRWSKRSDQRTDVVVVAFGQPATLWAAAHGAGVIRSIDGGRTWTDAGAGLTTFGGMANLGIDPRDNRTLYGIIQPEYAGSYLRRGTAEGRWVAMPAPQEDAAIQTGLAVEGSGALYVTTGNAPAGLWRSENPNVADVTDVTWTLVHDFGASTQASVLAIGWGPQGPALYANLWPLTPLVGGGAQVGKPVLNHSLDGGQTWTPLGIP